MICGSGKLAAKVKLCGKQQNKWDLVRKRQFFGKRLVVATNRKVEVVLNVDRRGQHGLGLQDLEDVQVPPAHGRWKGEKIFDMKFFEFLFKAKVILGFTASVGLGVAVHGLIGLGLWLGVPKPHFAHPWSMGP